VLDENCRNTQRIFGVVDRFYSGPQHPVPLGPEGQAVQVVPYGTVREGQDQLRRLLHHLLRECGFMPDEIVVLSALGLGMSAFLGKRLGNVQLTDRLPLRPGEVFGTTVRRFKGLERQVVVLCDVDGRISPEDAESLMYVGTSRAKTYLAILVGQDAPTAIEAALGGLSASVSPRDARRHGELRATC
jgi:hypothetical protein